jgi:Luciferase-like monooxygenase
MRGVITWDGDQWTWGLHYWNFSAPGGPQRIADTLAVAAKTAAEGPLASAEERFERLEETLQICLQMWSDNNGAYLGRHYQLAETLRVPAPLSLPRPPILIGGGGAQDAAASRATPSPTSWRCCAHAAKRNDATTMPSARPPFIPGRCLMTRSPSSPQLLQGWPSSDGPNERATPAGNPTTR